MEEQWIECFKAGTQTDSKGNTKEWTEADLDTMVAKHNEQSPETNDIAPVVLGHPQTNHPAFGWVSNLKREGNTLYAKLRNLVPEFVDMVKQKMYSNRSVSLKPDNTLVHLGFLGAVPPAVKGLAGIKFSTDEELITYEFTNQVIDSPKNEPIITIPNDDQPGNLLFLEGNIGMEEFIQAVAKEIKAKSGDEVANQVLAIMQKNKGLVKGASAPADKPAPKFSDDPDYIEMKRVQAEKDAERDKKFAEQEAKIREMEFEKYFSDKLTDKSPKIVVASKEPLRQLYNKLSADSTTLEFQDASGKVTLSPIQLLDKLIDTLPEHKLYQEFARDGQGDDQTMGDDLKAQNKAIDEYNKSLGGI